MNDYIEAQGSKEERRDLLKFHLGTASFGSPDEQAVRELLEDLEAAQATIALEHAARERSDAELAKDAERMREALNNRDSEWIRSAGRFRMALNEAGLHGHYTLFQEWEWPAALASTAPVAANVQKEGE